MTLSAFTDPAHRPDETDVSAALAAADALWNELVSGLRAAHPPLEAQWKHAGAKFGWSLRLVSRGKNMVYLTPQAGRFLVGIVLGERAVAMARERRASAAAIEALDGAPRYAEGRGLRIAVASRDDLRLVEELAALKFLTASR